MDLTDFLVGVAIVVGLVGIVVPVLPGTVLILGAVLVWALEVGSSAAWTVFAVAATFLVLGTVVKYAVPGRRLKTAGVPNATLWTGTAFGVIGFFVIPVIGLFLGFVLGVYLAEIRRVGSTQAWPSTRHALSAVGLSVLIELAAATLAAVVWFIGALALA